MKGMMVVSPRDVVLLNQISYSRNGCWYISVCSTEHDDKPELTNPVRATSPIGGWVLVPQEDGSTNCEYISELDPKGNFPDFIIKTAIKM